MGDIETWYRSVPIVTRTYGTLATITMAAVSTDLVTRFHLYLNWQSVLYSGEIWRILTCFVFFGNFSIDFFFHMYFLYRYCRSLEENSPNRYCFLPFITKNRSADFFWMLMIGAVMMLALTPIIKMPFLGAPMTFMAVYVFGRRNEFLQMSFMGLFNFTAPYLPYVLVGFSVVLGGGNIIADIMGIVCGHIYYFLAVFLACFHTDFSQDVYPRMTGRRLLKTPEFVLWMFGYHPSQQIEENE